MKSGRKSTAPVQVVLAHDGGILLAAFALRGNPGERSPVLGFPSPRACAGVIARVEIARIYALLEKLKSIFEVFFGGLFWLVIALLIHSWLFGTADQPSKLITLPLILIFVFGALFLVQYIFGLRSRLAHRSKKCPHGVAGGQTRNQCSACQEDLRLHAERLKQEEVNRERALQLEKQAGDLRQSEVRRLTEAKLRQLDYLLSLDPLEFEEAVAALYRKLGWKTRVTSQSNDRGKDVIATKDGIKILIECKRYSTDKRIGRPPLQKLFAAMAEERATRGVLVTTADFAGTAAEYAGRNKIELVNGEELISRMRSAFPSDREFGYYRRVCIQCGEVVKFSLHPYDRELTCPNSHIVSNDLDPKSLSPKLISDRQFCENCGKPMRVVRGRRGRFIGCSGYPACRTTMPIAN